MTWANTHPLRSPRITVLVPPVVTGLSRTSKVGLSDQMTNRDLKGFYLVGGQCGGSGNDLIRHDGRRGRDVAVSTGYEVRYCVEDRVQTMP
jgi:hypothetical protein